MEHIIRIKSRPDPAGEYYLFTGKCSCGFNCNFETTERVHVKDVLYEHAMNVADPQQKRTGFTN